MLKAATESCKLVDALSSDKDHRVSAQWSEVFNVAA